MTDKPKFPEAIVSTRGAVWEQSAAHATRAVPGIPRDENGPVFREPWEAQAFAMALTLHKRGLFTGTNGQQRLPTKLQARKQTAIPTPARPITGTGWRRWNAWLPKRASPPPKRCIATAMPGTPPPTARHMVRRSNLSRRILASTVGAEELRLSKNGRDTRESGYPVRRGFAIDLRLLWNTRSSAFEDDDTVGLVNQQLTSSPCAPHMRASPSRAERKPGIRRNQNPSHAARRVRRDSRCGSVRGSNRPALPRRVRLRATT